MAKIKGPLMSVSASGSIAKRVTFSQRKTGQQARWQNPPKDVANDAQLAVRLKYIEACTAWGLLSDEEKQVYRNTAQGKPLTGFNQFVKEYILSPLLSIYNWSDTDVAWSDTNVNWNGGI